MFVTFVAQVRRKWYPNCFASTVRLQLEEDLMELVRKLLTVVLAVLMAAPSLSAQDRHVVSPAALAAAMADRVTQEDADRGAVREALSRPEVRDVAARLGVDIGRAEAAVGTLADAQLVKAAAAARQVNQQLVGGQNTITLTTTTIIIALLIVILLVVAID
jgi:hypothetical protein